MVKNFEKEHSESIEHVNELIKVKQTLFREVNPEESEQLALNALNKDKQRQGKVFKAANLLRRLRKAKANEEKFKAAALEVYKLANIFNLN